MPWKVLDKRRNENTISKDRETQNKKRKHKYCFSVLTSKKEKSFQRLLSSTPWNKLAIVYTAKSESVLHSPTLSLFVCFNLVYRRVLFCRSEATTLVYDKHTPNCHYNIFYLSLTIFFLNAIMVNIMLEIINRLIGIKPKPATLLKE